MNGYGRLGRAAVLGAATLLGLPSARAAGMELKLLAGDEAGERRVEARFEAPVPPETAWAVLTDYEGMPRFVSSVKKSRLVRRDPDGGLLEQEAAGRLLFVSKKVRLLLSVTERRPEYVGFTDIDRTQFERYEGSWRIEAAPGGSVITYSLRARPDPSLAPEFAAAVVLKRSAKKLVEEVRAEMLRRTGT